MPRYHAIGEPSAAAQELTARIYAVADDEERYRDGLRSIKCLRTELDALELQLVAEARSARFKWADIGAWLDTTRQGAFNRFGSDVRPKTEYRVCANPACGQSFLTRSPLARFDTRACAEAPSGGRPRVVHQDGAH